MSNGGTVDARAMLDAWRSRGDDRVDPVRFRFIEVLARRMAAHHGETRRILDGKVHGLVVAYGQALEKAHGTIEVDASHNATPAAKPLRGALGDLVDHIGRRTSLHSDSPAAGDALAGLTSSSDVTALAYFRSTWSRLNAERRMAQSLATVPENAGPLNTHHLVHRSLALMRDMSPEYLNQFMSYVDALLWLDKANVGEALAGTTTSRGESPKKSRRGKADSQHP